MSESLDRVRRLDTGAMVGPYRIDGLIGTGGMGEVYRARDSKLGRDVAIKVLPVSVASDPDRLARFAREARLLATLNHPHIATIHGLEEADGVTALVMELVEGPTLAEKLVQDARPTVKGGFPLAEALRIGEQIAEALEAAHARGIIHRDLKPANIKLGHNGHTKLLDFGLAKAFSSDSSGSELSHLPTITTTGLRTGAISGTPGYMSPEQARGKPLDKRTDIWSFGCVLYEMLAGRSAFAGATVSDTIVAILEREPEWSLLPDTTPPAIRRLLRRCLEKDPRRRLHDVADVRIEIEDALTGPPLGSGEPGLLRGAGPASSRVSRRALVLAAATFLAMTVAIVVLAALAFRRPAADLRPLRLSIVPPEGTTFTRKDISGMPHFAVSPDGNRLAFVASAPGARPQLWVRQLDSGAAQPLPGTDDASGHFWAPDSRSLAFYARGKLKKVSLGGSLPQDLADAPVDVTSGTWNADGTIVFGGPGAGLFRMSAEGGPVVPVTEVDAASGEYTHRWPQFLPDGRRFIFHVGSTTPANSGVYLGSIDAAGKTQILRSTANAVYADSGHLLFDRAGTLMVQPFDARAGTLSGQPSAFGDRVLAAPGPGYLALSIGGDGTMAYWNGQAVMTELLWFDRNGRPLGKVGSAKPYQSPALSPGASNLLITEQISPGRVELWNIDLSSGVPSRLTFPVGEFSFARFGVWSPDGKNIVYSSFVEDGPHMYQIAASGTDQESVPFGPAFPEDWSRDGRWLVYSTPTAKTAWDTWTFNFTDQKPRPVLQELSNQLQARLSPDGRWLAYASDESGDWEVYVRPFPDGRGKWLVSTGGGSQPMWRGDGKELFYVAADDRLVAVPIGGTDTFEVGISQPLFATRIPPVLAPFRSNYAVSADGQRFLVNSVTPQAAPAPITITVNWQMR